MLLPFALQFKNALSSHFLFHTTANDIYEIVKQIPEVENLRNDPELLLLISNIAFNTLGKNKQGIDLKQIVITVEDKLFTLTDDEKSALGTQIEFLQNHNKIKSQSSVKLVSFYAFEWIKRKFL